MTVIHAFSIILLLLAVLMLLVGAFVEKFGRVGLVPFGLALFVFVQLLSRIPPPV